MAKHPQRDGFNYVPAIGPTTARIAVLGEAPGKTENAIRKPFVGAAGTMLTRWLRRVGLKRTDIYIDNTFPYRPNGKNDLSMVPERERRIYVDEMLDRLREMPDLEIIVPMGNFALQALVGMQHITKRRGSVYEIELGTRQVYVIPVIHPAAVLKSQKWERRCIRDWERIVEVLKHGYTPVRRVHEIMPTLRDVELFRDEQKARWGAYVRAGKKDAVPMLVTDVETPVRYTTKVVGHFKNGKAKVKKIKGERYVACVGYADSPTHSLTIPTTAAYWGGRDTLAKVWSILEEINDLPLVKGLQNGWFDSFHFERMGAPLRNWKHDSMAWHHVLIPNEDHDLGFMVSVDLWEPYFKDEGKGQDRGIPKDLEEYWTYCGKDCTSEFELIERYIEQAKRTSRPLPDGTTITAYDLYWMHHRRLLAPCLAMSVDGINSDEKIRRRRYAHLTADLLALRAKLTAQAGEDIFGKKGSLSTPKLQKFLHETLGLPKVTKFDKKKGEEKTTTNEIAVRQLQLRWGKKRPEVQDACQLVLDHRRKDKLRSFYAEKVADTDGRIRCTFSPAPETARLASRKSPLGTGMNLQNIDREARDHFIPDDGHIFLRVDLSQAESRWVYMLSGDNECIELARAQPWEYDDHGALAQQIFRLSDSEWKRLKEENKKDYDTKRFFGKKTNHASNYDMQGKKMSEELLKDGIVETPGRCQEYIEVKMDWRPAIRDVFHRTVRRQIITEKRLVNSWGHALDFTDLRLGPEVFREGYAFYPQSEVAFIINQYGMIPLWRHLTREYGVYVGRKLSPKIPRLRNQVHDELIVSTPPGEAWELWQFLKENLERPRPTPYGELTIPAEVKVGMSWGSGTEWKRPPTKKVFEEVVYGLFEQAIKAA